MALENVVEEIISQAEKQKQEIILGGKEEAEKIIAEALQRTKQQLDSAGEETVRILEENRKMELSSLNIRLHKMLLNAKRNVLEELYAQLVEKVNKMSPPERKEVLQRLVNKAKKEMPDAKYAYCNERDNELITGLQVKGAADCIGGVIVANSDESVRINYTFDVLMQKVKEENMNEIAKKIFR